MNHKVAFSFADGKTLFFPVGAHEILLDAALRTPAGASSLATGGAGFKGDRNPAPS